MGAFRNQMLSTFIQQGGEIMTDCLRLNRSQLSALYDCHTHALSVYVQLLERAAAQPKLKTGLTLNELTRATRLSPNQIRRTLISLHDEGFIRLTVKDEKKRTYVIEVIELDKTTQIPYTDRDTDQTKLALLEEEIRRLTREVERAKLGLSSGLDSATRGEERDLILEIEGVFGRGLDPVDAYWLGRVVSAYGPERVKQEFRRMKLAKNPIRAVVGALNKGSRGKAAEQRTVEVERVTYREL